jgi:carboxyl-terminal processing protease
MVYFLGFSLLASVIHALPMNEIDHFALVYESVKQVYVDEIDEKTLMNYAISGLVQNLDPHSDYISDTLSVNAFEQSTEGQFGGLGFELSPKEGMIEIMSVIPDSPASEAGLQSHDMILMIDHTLTQGMTLREASQKIRGPIGSKVSLTILPAESKQPIEKILIRSLIKNPSVQGQTIDEWGYLRVNVFSQDTGKDFLVQLEHQLSLGVKGILLDLRNNPGGLLKESVVVANAFLNADTILQNNSQPIIVTAQGRKAQLYLEEIATGNDMTHGMPIVVLINQGSASASEIVAGALQDYGRAVIVGEKSFGKGSVQTVIPIENNLLKMTCSRYFTPSGRSIQANGIKPDILVMGSWVLKDDSGIQIGEQNLNRHLEPQAQPSILAENSASLYQKDPILAEGLRILKALSIQNIKNY